MFDGWMLILAASVMLFMVSCTPTGTGGSAPAAGPAAGPTATLPAEIASLTIANARMPAPGLLTGGQVTREQMAALRSLGYRTFISLRPAGESGTGGEEEFARSEGIAFERIPVAGEADLTRDAAEQLAAALHKAGAGPVMVYCGSGNRVGALLALQASYLDGRSPEEALAFGKNAGLTRLEPKVRELLGLQAE